MFRLQFHYQVRLGEFRQFYDLFEQPKQTWPIPVLHVRTAAYDIPFAAWLSRTDRVEY